MGGQCLRPIPLLHLNNNKPLSSKFAIRHNFLECGAKLHDFSGVSEQIHSAMQTHLYSMDTAGSGSLSRVNFSTCTFYSKSLKASMKAFPVRIGDRLEMEVPAVFGKYEIIRMIGSGSFSVVALVVHKPTNNQFACKICSRKLLMESHTFDRFEQEVRLLQVMRHPNLVSLFEVVFDENLIYVVMEYCSNGELFQYIVDNRKLPTDLVHRIFKQLVSAMVYIHSKDIAHRDLKPENILLDENLNPKIADFGLCHVATANQLLKTPCGSPFYAPPEIILNEEYDGKAGDVWSLGVVLYTMATGTVPWRQNANQMSLFEDIKTANFHIPAYLDDKLKDLITIMMNPAPKERPTMEQVLKAPWVVEDPDCFLEGCGISVFGNRSAAMFMSKTPAPSNQTIQRRQVIVRPTVASAQSLKTYAQNAGHPIASLIRRVPNSGKHRPLL